jgi:hypothetical protein
VVAVAVAGLVVVALVALSPPAAAHLAIRLDIRWPQPGSSVGRSTDALVFAQATLAGVDSVTFTPLLDGQPVGPTRLIRVSTEEHVALPMLAPGHHTFAVRYRPDVDEPVTITSVAFTVRRPGSHAGVIAAGVALALVVVVAGGVLVARR